MSYAGPYSTPLFDPLTEGVLGRRVWAWVIDFLLIGALVCALWVALFAFGLLTLGLAWPLFGLLPLVPVAYHTLFVAGGRSATPGQAMMDLTVRREHDLGPPTLLQAVLFTAGLWFTFSTAFVLLGVVFFTPGKRALHDIVAGVAVVRKSALTAAGGSATMGSGSPYA